MTAATDAPAPWYESAVTYQIPVALFNDTKGNSWGDLRGVTERLDHVADLAADAVWLQPFYRTPYVDGGTTSSTPSTCPTGSAPWRTSRTYGPRR